LTENLVILNESEGFHYEWLISRLSAGFNTKFKTCKLAIQD
jgi:hypothetical protein